MGALHSVEKNNKTYNAGFLISQILDFTDNGRIILHSNMNEAQCYTVEVPASTGEIVNVISGDYYPAWFEDLMIFYFDISENFICKNGKWYDNGKRIVNPTPYGLITFLT